jgi:hypothetical protein
MITLTVMLGVMLSRRRIDGHSAHGVGRLPRRGVVMRLCGTASVLLMSGVVGMGH